VRRFDSMCVNVVRSLVEQYIQLCAQKPCRVIHTPSCEIIQTRWNQASRRSESEDMTVPKQWHRKERKLSFSQWMGGRVVKGASVGLICGATVATAKRHNVERHFTMCHTSYHANYQPGSALRAEKAHKSMAALCKQLSFFTRLVNTFHSGRIRLKSSSLRVFLRRSISADICARKLFKPSKDSASLRINNEKKFLVVGFSFLWVTS